MVLFAQSVPFVAYYAMYLVTAVLAVVHSPIWNAAHLVDIVTYVSHLRLIVIVTNKHKLRLIATIALGLIVVYGYVVLVFVFFRNRIKFNTDDDVVYDCESLWDCVQKGIDLGFRNVPTFVEDPVPMATPVFDLVYFLLINTILVSIITGIIIDTFAEMRANRDSIAEQVDSECFICRISAEEFNKSKNHNGFYHHITVEHNVWSYVYLKYYIEEQAARARVRLTGVDLHASKIIAEGAAKMWRLVPRDRTLHLPQEGQGDDRKRGTGKVKL